ncbi:hypothetical protein OSB04_un000452 [Centaurea solstitialis]|uniref:Jacalin-type lectin domain-containing protein n=1 Tax=Centaurea solstitialis TaxID=347529 RepID=A0AA38W2L4_9ASTR|nr:hypothetical protein OSB04_un000452 [Centaurea solstitialis]
MPEGSINKIGIIHGAIIFCLKFQSEGDKGQTELENFSFGRNPVPRTSKLDTICIDYPNEYLKSISGTFENFNGIVLLRSLCFDTNQMRYGPYGLKSGIPFSYDGKGGVIVGFHGRVDPNGLSALGIYVMPESLALYQNSTSEKSSIDDQLCSNCISRMVPMRDAGPWGALGGKRWDDGVFSTVKQVHVYMDESLKVLHAIQFLYVKRDAIIYMDHNLELINWQFNLDGLDEYLTGISGFYGPVEGYHGSEAITSITFHTNKKVHGPYGEERGPEYTYFTSSACPGKVVGFQGRNDEFVSAIGVHMEYF